jgi:phage/plasmid-associated DNA primase
MYCSEPEAKAKLNTNFVKMLTGDVIKARGLYSNTDSAINPTYDIFVCCNALPSFDTYDEGIARRIKLLEYKTKFCENPKKDNEKLLNRYTNKEIEEIECGLLNMFIKRFSELRLTDYKYSEPIELINLRNLYINDTKDEISNILKESYIVSHNKDDYVKLKDVKTLLKSRGLEKDQVSIKYIIKDTFCDSEFFLKLNLKNRSQVRTVFSYLLKK